ncbi:unnamed protein product [Durusdinium trenchii]|uniref:Pseudouridine synthase RsuA/RluA-like domain-containing protein n=1 Tax=Durusdinium trenchii TaxID=1381693 RepID=A0ABP0N850_9DINO
MPPTVHGSSALALEIVSELQRHGGRLMANHLFYGRPDLRKRMGDEKLLQFLQAFPHLVQIHERSGGHALEVVDLQLGPPTVGLGRAPSGALGGQGAPERGVHALRALERDLQNTLRAKRPEQHTQVRYLLHNGKLRRRIGAVVRFLPVPELIQVERMNGSPVNGVESEMPRGCPVSAHARTYAAYLLQFLRDRPGKFQLEHGGRQDSTPCANGDCCSCQFQVLLLPQDVLDEDTSFIDLLLLKIQQMMQKTGSQKVPLVRLGRDPQVQEALGGRSLLHCLERHLDQPKPLFRLETSVSIMVSLVRPEEVPGVASPAAEHDIRRNERRKMRNEPPVTVLGEAPGMAVLLKSAGRTTEAELWALQEAYDRENLQRRVVSVSRLDRDTSGVLVCALGTEAAEVLTQQFKEHQVFKRYLALCTGRVEPAEGEINAKLYISGFAEKYRAYVSPKGKPSVTFYEVLGVFRRTDAKTDAKAPQLQEVDELSCALQGYAKVTEMAEAREEYSLLACYPGTGRTHQIRAHLQFKGYPIVSDANYSARGKVRPQFEWCPRLWLHCAQMSLLDLEGQWQDWRAPLANDLQRVLRKLEAEDGRSGLEVLQVMYLHSGGGANLRPGSLRPTAAESLSGGEDPRLGPQPGWHVGAGRCDVRRPCSSRVCLGSGLSLVW